MLEEAEFSLIVGGGKGFGRLGRKFGFSFGWDLLFRSKFLAGMVVIFGEKIKDLLGVGRGCVFDI